MPTTKFVLIGSGLAGGLLAAYLGRRGYDVDLYERRADPREGNLVGGRSINLALNSAEPSPIELPSSWTLTVEPPIAFRYDGICTGGTVRLKFPAGERIYRLQPPYCRPEAL